ncbi:hypothetical protein [Streptomyces sp. GbtcB6]|uniref:hypothetical protein n=1 Tax=Streptomyces sp. GbtcB6 TaxID=2824751 RepID=UPI001C30453B|nr:hypothetical protein [Streptomyces sp. GbtcB6]
MTTLRSQIVVDAPLPAVRQILLEPSAPAAWNPAFLDVTAPTFAAVGHRYLLWTRGALTGFFEYLRVSDTLIAARWEVPGFIEDHTWALCPTKTARRSHTSSRTAAHWPYCSARPSPTSPSYGRAGWHSVRRTRHAPRGQPGPQAPHRADITDGPGIPRPFHGLD